jgi:hypothetical protein
MNQQPIFRVRDNIIERYSVQNLPGKHCAPSPFPTRNSGNVKSIPDHLVSFSFDNRFPQRKCQPWSILMYVQNMQINSSLTSEAIWKTSHFALHKDWLPLTHRSRLHKFLCPIFPEFSGLANIHRTRRTDPTYMVGRFPKWIQLPSQAKLKMKSPSNKVRDNLHFPRVGTIYENVWWREGVRGRVLFT